MAEHLLDGPQVGAALQQVRRERVPQQVRVDAVRVEARVLGEAAQDQERAGTGQRRRRARSGRAPGDGGSRGTGRPRER